MMLFKDLLCVPLSKLGRPSLGPPVLSLIPLQVPEKTSCLPSLLHADTLISGSPSITQALLVQADA